MQSVPGWLHAGHAGMEITLLGELLLLLLLLPRLHLCIVFLLRAYMRRNAVRRSRPSTSLDFRLLCLRRSGRSMMPTTMHLLSMIMPHTMRVVIRFRSRARTGLAFSCKVIRSRIRSQMRRTRYRQAGSVRWRWQAGKMRMHRRAGWLQLLRVLIRTCMRRVLLLLLLLCVSLWIMLVGMRHASRAGGREMRMQRTMLWRARRRSTGWIRTRHLCLRHCMLAGLGLNASVARIPWVFGSEA